jgi:hypothetical protein
MNKPLPAPPKRGLIKFLSWGKVERWIKMNAVEFSSFKNPA